MIGAAPVVQYAGGSMKTIFAGFMLAGVLALAGGCAPEVGSDRWCENMKAKAKADWSANEAKDFAKHCIFK
jgi:hypothetical protein